MTMVGEEKKSGSTRISNVIEAGVEPGDDEPIGSLIKLKKVRKAKRVKDVDCSRGKGNKVEVRAQKLVVEDEKLGGMDDTLASLRKKLKGPKKDCVSLAAIDGISSWSTPEQAGQLCNELVKDGTADVKSMLKVEKKGHVMADDGYDATGDKSSENKPVGKSKRSRCTSMPKTIKVDLETADGQNFRELVDGSAIKEKAYNCFSNLTNEIVKDSLSSFVKSQAALIKKSRSSRSSKKKRGLEATGNESIPSSKDDLDSFRPMAVRRPRPGSGSSLACSNEVCESSSCPVSRTAADFAHDQAKVLDYQKPDDGFSEPFTCRQEYMSSGGLDQGLSSSTSSLVALLKKRKYGDNVSRGQVNGSQVCTIDACASNKDMEEIIESTIDLNSAAVNQNALENKNSENGFSHCSVGRESDLKYNDASISNSISFSVPKQRNEICFANMSVLTDASDQPLEPCPGNDMLRNSCGSPLKQLCKKLCERTVELSSKPPCQSTYPSEGQMDGGFNFEGENDSSIGNGRKEKACSCYGHNQTHSICTIEPNGYVRSDEAGILSNPSSLGLPLNEYVTSTECGRLASEQNQPYYYVSTEKFLPTQDNICVSEEAIGVYSPSPTPDENETYPEDAVLMHDSANNDLKFSTVQRAVRKSKKIRLEDMAYEGDADWEILTHERSLLQEYQDPDGDSSYKMKEKLDSISSTVTEAENSGAAAVSVGMKAHAVGPIEKIKFKDVLKRKGGLQEYLECRNKILHIWSKDVTRILPLAECGVTDTPFEDEPPRASLIRKIYTFLDQNGYINVGIASEKEKSGPKANPSYTLVEDKYLVEHSGLSTADTEDGVSFILGRVKSSNASMSEKNDVLIDVANQLSEATNDTKVVTRVSKSLCQTDHSNWSANNIQPNDEAKPFSELVDGENLPLASNNVILDGGKVPASSPSLIKESCSIQTVTNHKDEHQKLCNSGKRVIVIGAGPAGLTAARHLQRQGFSVVILEARGRIGGRVYTDRSSLSVPVDLGASIITGVEADVATERRPDPSSLVCAQLGLELTVLNSDCPLYDIVSGQKVPAQLDEALEAEFNSLLDDMILLVAQKGEHAMRMSLEDGLEYALKRCRLDRSSRKECEVTRLSDVPFSVSEKINFDNSSLEKNGLDEEVLCPLERRVMDWHFANLEYGCAALLKEVSLPYWNQDDAYGGFGGAHCMIKGGYSTVLESLAKGLAIHLNHVVAGISYSSEDSNLPDNQSGRVEVFTSSGSKFSGDAVLITVPLGCLKAEAISFSPSLPQWKLSSIQRLGFGVLNKVVLEFPHVFWDDSVDYFGATAEKTSQRGQCFMFWNVRKTVGAPVLIALVVGKAALVGQNLSADDHVKHAVTVLRTLFGESSVPDPVASIVTDWGRDPFSFGAYSYVAIGASGEDYDILGRPVDNCLFFAGEATCKEHPDTVGGAMMSGIREAVRIIDILSTGNDYTAEVEAMEAAQRHSDSERNEVRDITKRLEAIELSNVLYKNSVDRAHILTREALLCDMFFNAKTTAGRLHLAKELLSLPVESLKSFAGTKYGLAVLNSWMLDSMGKDGTQLLRHCVRILVLVSTNLLAVRLSGIGKTVKEKVCVHTSRDIRAIASQLVSVWIEVFRKEKVSNGGLKLLRQATALDCSKSKSTKGLASGKPPLRQHSNAPDDRRDLQASASAGRHCLSNTLHHKVNSQSIKLHRANESKSDINFSKSESSIARVEVQEEDNFAMSEEEQAAIAAAEAARAAALAAAQAYASESKSNALLPLPKIPSFHKFARREQYAHMDESDARKKWSGGVLGRQDCISEIDSRNCRVRDWSVDFAAAGVNFDSSRVSMDNLSHRSHSCEIASHTNLREHSGESVAGDSSVFTKAWVDSAGSVGLKDYHAIERWQSQPAADGSDVLDRTAEMKDEEDSCNVSEKLHDKFVNDSSFSLQQNESSVSQVTLIKQPVDNQPRGSEHIKQAVMDYVASLLMPLYKAQKIDREGYKVIMKRTATKVIEATTDAEKAMNVSEFLDFKRRNKIRAFVDKLIEKQMAVKPDGKS